MRFPRFTVRRQMLAVAVVAVILGGYFWLTRPRSVELRPHPLPTRINVDHDIFDVALSDLLVNGEFAVRRLKDQVAKLVLDIKTEEGFPQDPQSGGSFWAILGKNQVDPEILQDMNERNPRRVRNSLAGYKPSNPGIAVFDFDTDPDMNDFVTQFSRPPWVTLLLPGYSKDGKTAVLRFSFGPTAHGANGVYLLRRVNGRWEIMDKQMFHYL